MRFLIYDSLFLLFALLYFPYLVLRGKWHKGFYLRFGFSFKSIQQHLGKDPRIWIHAVSVGEVLAVEGLIKILQERFPRYKIILSTVTRTGYQIACSKLPKGIPVIFAPLDLSWVVRQFIKVIDPKIYICVETEIWPNLFYALWKKKIPIVLVNGRVSKKSFRNYSLFSFLTKSVLGCVCEYLMQTQDDQDRLIRLGVARDRIRVVGNLKFDETEKEFPQPQKWGFNPLDWLLIAGSTHPGEEEILLKIYQEIGGQFKRLKLILAPRHIERVKEIEECVLRKGLPCQRLSQSAQEKKSPPVVIVDTIGQLKSLYALAKIVFVGKSLKGKGGQNILEPAMLGKAIIVGPHMQNFNDIMKTFLKSNAIIQVPDEHSLKSEIVRLLSDPQECALIGERARQTVEANRGNALKTVEILGEYLKSN